MFVKNKNKNKNKDKEHYVHRHRPPEHHEQQPAQQCSSPETA